MPTISVIIPVYKVEAYLRDCVDSVLAQTFTDFEIILVDDGSPDNCGAICDEYAAREPRVRVIHQENGGLSSARNSGVKNSQGRYISFVDSDDMLHPQALELMLEALQRESAELCIIRTERDRSQVFGQSYQPALCVPERIDGVEALARLCGTKNQTLPLPQEEWLLYSVAAGKLFTRDIVTANPFPLGRYHEDEFNAHRFFYAAKTVAVLNLPLYYYRINASGITAKHNRAVTRDGIYARLDRIAFLKEHGLDELAAKVTPAWSAMEYAIYCKADGVKNDLPKAYRYSVPGALYRMKKNTSPERFKMYLRMAYPRIAVLAERFLK